MSRATMRTGGRRAGQVTARAARQAWSAALGPLARRVRTVVTSGNARYAVERWARRGGRWLVVRLLASVGFRPRRWAAGAAVAGFVIPGPWWLASIAIVPLGLYRWVSKPSGGRASTILRSVSRRVKSLRLRQALLRRWTPLLVDLGMSKTADRRPRWKPWKPAVPTTVVPRVSRVELGEWGVSARVDLRPLNLGVSSLSKITERIESGLSSPACSVQTCSIRKIGSGLATMDLRHSDPLAETVRVADLPEPRRYLHVVPALAEDGSGVEQPLPPLHLTVGATRAGKSQFAWTLIKLILDRGIPLRLRIFDPKAQEWAGLADVAYDYESDVARWPAFLGRAFGGLRKRQVDLARRGVQELRQFTERDPLDLMILDEFLSVLAMRNADVKVGGQTMRAYAVLDQYASQCIAAGYGMAAAAQLGQKETIGAVRDLFPTAASLRVPPQASEMVNAVLGPGSADRYPAHLIPFGRHTAGQGYWRTPSGLVLRTRVAYLDDDERAEVKDRLREETARFGGPYRAKQAQRREKAEAAA